MKKLPAMIWQGVFLHFLVMFSNRNGCAHIKKIVKTLMEFFPKFSILTENLVDFDVTCSVILGTVSSLLKEDPDKKESKLLLATYMK